MFVLFIHFLYIRLRSDRPLQNIQHRHIPGTHRRKHGPPNVTIRKSVRSSLPPHVEFRFMTSLLQNRNSFIEPIRPKIIGMHISYTV